MFLTKSLYKTFRHKKLPIKHAPLRDIDGADYAIGAKQHLPQQQSRISTNERNELSTSPDTKTNTTSLKITGYNIKNVQINHLSTQWKSYTSSETDESSSLINDDATNPIGTEVPSTFHLAVPTIDSKIYPRSVDPELHYSDFAGLRYPTLADSTNTYNYWDRKGVDQFTEHVSPLFLPAYKRLSPYLRELIWFLHHLDSVRFSVSKISEHYALKEYTVEKICQDLDRTVFIKEYRLTRNQRQRIHEAEAIMKKKEDIYAKRIGYDVIGDQWISHKRKKNRRVGGASHDPLLRQAIHVEALSAFPLPTLRDPIIKKANIDLEVKTTSNIKIINWIDPVDAVVI